MEERTNCWEFTKCGREPGGRSVDKFGICPAPMCEHLSGVNHGKAAGRFCWAVDGTLCQGSFKEKFPECTRCSFFKEVNRQEGISLVLNPEELGDGRTMCSR